MFLPNSEIDPPAGVKIPAEEEELFKIPQNQMIPSTTAAAPAAAASRSVDKSQTVDFDLLGEFFEDFYPKLKPMNEELWGLYSQCKEAIFF